MISKKVFNANGTNTRYLSDFIIRSEQFARPYVYIYDNTLAENGSEDQLVDGSIDQADWSWPDNIWKRGSNIPQAGDIVTEDKWQVVDNSILFYLPPIDTSSVWLEVATTAEEFGDTLIDASVEEARLAAEASATSAAESAASAVDATTNGQIEVWKAEAEQLTADSYATQAEDVLVNVYTSDGDGTFTATPTTEYSALHWAAKADASATAADTESGTYTPTYVGTNNVSVITHGGAFYNRIGNIVNVTVRFNVAMPASYTFTTLTISLPIASNLSSEYDCIGHAQTDSSEAGYEVSPTILADITNNDKALMRYSSSGDNVIDVYTTFTYKILP